MTADWVLQRQEALKKIVTAADDRLRAQSDYEAAVLEAHRLGVRNTAIARELGVSETSIRLFIKRREDKL